MATRRPMGGGRMLRAVGRAVGAGVGGVKEAIAAGGVGRPGKPVRIENPDWPQINNRLLSSSRSKLRNILEVLMESTPQEIDATRLGMGLCEMDGVVAVHELHIWAITMGKVLLACHVTITPEADADRILDEVIGYIRKEYNISHVIIQIERL